MIHSRECKTCSVSHHHEKWAGKTERDILIDAFTDMLSTEVDPDYYENYILPGRHFPGIPKRGYSHMKLSPTTSG